VRSRGVALVDGYLGEKIKVKRIDSKKTVEGTLISSSEVEVKI
jgi:flagella basal body P-ring formation protein FlgA